MQPERKKHGAEIASRDGYLFIMTYFVLWITRKIICENKTKIISNIKLFLVDY